MAAAGMKVQSTWGAVTILVGLLLLPINHSADTAITMVEPGSDRCPMPEELQSASMEGQPISVLSKENVMKKFHQAIATVATGALLLTVSVGAAAIATPQAAPTAESATSAPAPATDIQPDGGTVVAQNRISVGASADAVGAALAKCQSDNLPFVTVALVDRFGTVQALLRGDNAAEHTIEAAKQKAYTAAAFGTPTSELAKRITGGGPGIDDLPGTLFLPGGVPLKVDGVSVAGIGVGGAPDGKLDEACAAAGAAQVTGADR